MSATVPVYRNLAVRELVYFNVKNIILYRKDMTSKVEDRKMPKT